MTCFNCGKVGEKTGHDGCKNSTTPNAAGIKAKEAYRKQFNDKKKHKSSARSNIESDSSESDSDSDPLSASVPSWNQPKRNHGNLRYSQMPNSSQ